jgi:serine/threonine protein kinase
MTGGSTPTRPPEIGDRTLRHLLEMVGGAPLGGRYELRGEIGHGGMGIVFQARDHELGRDVAVKVVGGARLTAEATARLQREARVLAGLEHPGIVPVHDVGTLDDGRPFYVMKLVRGRRFDEWAADGRPLAERLRAFQRICEPVAFAHHRGVVHRDLKPQNVMVGAFGEVLVLDWGVAKLLGATGAAAEPAALAQGATPPAREGTAAGTVLGTPGFMAPEQARGDVESVGSAADVHALGAILHVLVTGVLPGAPEARRAPPAVLAIAQRCLAADPAGRYPSATAVADDVACFLDDEPVSAYPEGLFRRLARLAGKYRTPLLLVLAYMLMRAALIFWSRE